MKAMTTELIAFVLGGVTFFGAQKLYNKYTEAKTEFDELLSYIRSINKSVEKASQKWEVPILPPLPTIYALPSTIPIPIPFSLPTIPHLFAPRSTIFPERKERVDDKTEKVSLTTFQ